MRNLPTELKRNESAGRIVEMNSANPESSNVVDVDPVTNLGKAEDFETIRES
jgi:hypothetical protein